MSRAVTAVALAALLVLAGCNAPVQPETESTPTVTETGTTTPPPTSTPPATTTSENESPGDAIEVRGGTLPFDPNLVFERVTLLLEADVPPPALIDVKEHDTMTTEARSLPAFATTMGIGDGDRSREVATAGITRGANYVALNARLASDEDRARGVLVHEFVHVVQYRQGSLDTAYENVQPGSTDSQMTYLAIVEGVPVFVEDEYARTYGDGGPTGMDDMIRGYRNADGVQKYALAPYAFGAKYAKGRAVTASNASRLYKTPPRTTEAIIHHYAPGEEPIRPLRTNVTDASWQWSDRDRLGELFVRQVLVTELNETRAATAAEGWGVDRQLTFTRENETAYVWALRWDSAADADEFERATRAYLDSRGERHDGVWRVDDTSFRLDRPSPEVVVLVVGPGQFVEDTAVSGTNESVGIETANAA